MSAIPARQQEDWGGGVQQNGQELLGLPSALEYASWQK